MRVDAGDCSCKVVQHSLSEERLSERVSVAQKAIETGFLPNAFQVSALTKQCVAVYAPQFFQILTILKQTEAISRLCAQWHL